MNERASQSRVTITERRTSGTILADAFATSFPNREVLHELPVDYFQSVNVVKVHSPDSGSGKIDKSLVIAKDKNTSTIYIDGSKRFSGEGEIEILSCSDDCQDVVFTADSDTYHKKRGADKDILRIEEADSDCRLIGRGHNARVFHTNADVLVCNGDGGTWFMDLSQEGTSFYKEGEFNVNSLNVLAGEGLNIVWSESKKYDYNNQRLFHRSELIAKGRAEALILDDETKHYMAVVKHGRRTFREVYSEADVIFDDKIIGKVKNPSSYYLDDSLNYCAITTFDRSKKTHGLVVVTHSVGEQAGEVLGKVENFGPYDNIRLEGRKHGEKMVFKVKDKDVWRDIIIKVNQDSGNSQERVQIAS